MPARANHRWPAMDARRALYGEKFHRLPLSTQLGIARKRVLVATTDYCTMDRNGVHYAPHTYREPVTLAKVP